jgi:hypothetical protein
MEKEAKVLTMHPSIGTPRTPLAPGVVIMLAELNCFVQVPELTLGQREDNEDLLAKLMEMGAPKSGATPAEVRAHDKESLNLLKQVTLIALRRNYPDVTMDAVRAFSLSDLVRAMRYAVSGAKEGESPAAPAPSGMANGKAASA